MAWVKTYTALLSDPDYTELTETQRAVLHGLWMLFGLRGKPLEWSTRYLGRALTLPSKNLGTTLDILKSRNFIELCGSTSLEESREDKRRVEKTPPISPSRGKSDFDEWFERWWGRQPRKIGKAGCKRKIQSLLKAKVVSREKLDLGLAGLVAKVEAEGTETQYIPHPLTWLNQGRWDDDHTIRRKMTDAERLEAWANGDERDDHGACEIDGECVEVPGRGFGSDGEGIPPGPEGTVGRPGESLSDGTVERMVETGAAQASGYLEDSERTKAAVEELAAIAAKRAKP